MRVINRPDATLAERKASWARRHHTPVQHHHTASQAVILLGAQEGLNHVDVALQQLRCCEINLGQREPCNARSGAGEVNPQG